MTAGFIAFGLGVPAFGLALRKACPGPAWMSAVATGIATLGVAAFPLGDGPDTAHAVCAGAGYATLAAVPLLAAPSLRGATAQRISVAAGVASAVALAATTVGTASGLWQRIGLTVGDAWIVATALRMVAGTMPPCSSGWTSK